MNLSQLKRFTHVGIFCGALLVATNTRAEEDTSQVMTALSSSSLSGVVDTSSVFFFGGSVDYLVIPGSYALSMPQMATAPGSFAGATTPPTAIESVVYFSRESTFHSSIGSGSSTPTEISSDEPYPMPVEVIGVSGSFTFSGAGQTFNPSTGIVGGPAIPMEPTTNIPEPSTVALFVGGLSLLALRRRKSQN